MKLTNRSKVVSNKKMTLAEKAYLPAIVKGMSITLKHFLRKIVRYNIQNRKSQGLKYGVGDMFLKEMMKVEKDVPLVDFVRLLALRKPLR